MRSWSAEQVADYIDSFSPGEANLAWSTRIADSAFTTYQKSRIVAALSLAPLEAAARALVECKSTPTPFSDGIEFVFDELPSERRHAIAAQVLAVFGTRHFHLRRLYGGLPAALTDAALDRLQSRLPEQAMTTAFWLAAEGGNPRALERFKSWADSPDGTAFLSNQVADAVEAGRTQHMELFSSVQFRAGALCGGYVTGLRRLEALERRQAEEEARWMSDPGPIPGVVRWAVETLPTYLPPILDRAAPGELSRDDLAYFQTTTYDPDRRLALSLGRYRDRVRMVQAVAPVLTMAPP